MAGHDRLTLLTATKRLDLSQAAILADAAVRLEDESRCRRRAATGREA